MTGCERGIVQPGPGDRADGHRDSGRSRPDPAPWLSAVPSLQAQTEAPDSPAVAAAVRQPGPPGDRGGRGGGVPRGLAALLSASGLVVLLGRAHVLRGWTVQRHVEA